MLFHLKQKLNPCKKSEKPVAACVDGRKRRHCTFPYEFGNVYFLTERLTEGTLTAQPAERPKADAVCSRPSGLIIVMFYQCGILRSDNFINSKALLKDNV